MQAREGHSAEPIANPREERVSEYSVPPATQSGAERQARTRSGPSRKVRRTRRGASVAEPEESLGCLQSTKRRLQSIIHAIIPPGGLLASAFNMASASIGAGILGLPAATNSAGLVLAVLYLVVITFYSVFSMYILALTSQRTRIQSFEGMARWLFPYGHYAFSYWAAFIRWFHAFAGNVAYVISVGNCFKPIFAGAYARNPDNSALRYLSSTSGNRLITSGVWLFIMLPLVIPKHVDSLRYASTLAIMFMVYFVIIIIIHSCTHGLPEHRNNVKLHHHHGDPLDENSLFLFRTGNPVVSSVGVFMFTYVCQINAMEVYADMPASKRSPRYYTLAALLGMLICGCLYLLVCIFGYYDFASAIGGNSILLMYKPMEEPEVMVAYVGVLVKLCVAYALLTIASRNSIYYMIGWQARYSKPKNKDSPVSDEEGMDVVVSGGSSACNPDFAADAVREDGDEMNSGLEDDDGALKKPQRTDPQARMDMDEEVDTFAEDTFYVDNIPFWKHVIVVVILSVASLLCGLFIPKINMVFGFAGAISGGFMAFIFPALFFMYSGNFTVRDVGWFNYLCTYSLLLAGVAGVVFGTGGTIYNTAMGI